MTFFSCVGGEWVWPLCAAADGAQGDLHGEQLPQPRSESPPPANARQPKRRTRSTWAELMLRAFSIDVLKCPHCGGLRELIAFLTDGLVVRKILVQDPRAPRAPDRGAKPRARASTARVRVRRVEGRILDRAS